MKTTFFRTIRLPLRAVTALALLLLAMTSNMGFAQTFPNKSVTLVVPNPPGGFVDASARILSDSLAKVVGQAVVVDNRGGGSGNVAYQYVARANPEDQKSVV